MNTVRLALCLLVLWQTDIGFANEMRKPWTQSTACPKECICSASSLTTMRIPPPQVVKQMATCSTIPQTGMASSINSIKLNDVIDQVTPNLLAKLNGKSLEYLNLSNSEITHVAAGSFAKLTKLISLDLSNNKIEAIDMNLFKNNIMLKQLFLDRNMLKQIPDGTFAKCKNLEELHLERNQLREFPTKLPPKLTKLVISHNDILALDGKMGQTNLKYLDLCNNHVEEWTAAVLTSLSKIQELCLGVETVTLPENAAAHIPNIAHLTLIATLEDPSWPELSNVTRSEISKMHNLASLAIENYQMDSLDFLLTLTKLTELRLENVMVTSINSVQMKTIFANNPYLSKISFNRSPKVADIVINSIYMVENLRDLQLLSLQQAEVQHLESFDVPNPKFRIDISHNPLHCDCRFKWLHQMDAASMHHLLACSENTTCTTPQQVRLEDFVRTLECDKILTTEEPEPTEMFTFAHNGDGSDYDDQSITDHVTDSDRAGITDQLNTSEQTGETDQSNTSNQFGEAGLNGNSEEVQEQDSQGVGHTNDNQDSDNVDTEQTEETIDAHQEDNNNENEQNIDEETNGEDHEEELNQDGREQSYSSHHKPRNDNDEHAEIYIILGCVLLVLVLVGVILGVVYWKYKQDGHKVAPSSVESPIEPIEPTYKQALASEDTTLIKK